MPPAGAPYVHTAREENLPQTHLIRLISSSIIISYHDPLGCVALAYASRTPCLAQRLTAGQENKLRLPPQPRPSLVSFVGSAARQILTLQFSPVQFGPALLHQRGTRPTYTPRKGEGSGVYYSASGATAATWQSDPTCSPTRSEGAG